MSRKYSNERIPQSLGAHSGRLNVSEWQILNEIKDKRFVNLTFLIELPIRVNLEKEN